MSWGPPDAANHWCRLWVESYPAVDRNGVFVIGVRRGGGSRSLPPSPGSVCCSQDGCQRHFVGVCLTARRWFRSRKLQCCQMSWPPRGTKPRRIDRSWKLTPRFFYYFSLSINSERRKDNKIALSGNEDLMKLPYTVVLFSETVLA